MSDTTLLSSWLSPEKGDEVLLFLHPNVSRRNFRKLCLTAASQLSSRPEKVIAFSFNSRVLAAAAFVGALAARKIPALFPGKRTNLVRMKDCFDLIFTDHNSGIEKQLLWQKDSPSATDINEIKLSTEDKFLLFTSGSTGKPKAVFKTLGQMDKEARITSQLFGNLCRDYAFASSTDFCHLYALTFSFWLPIALNNPIWGESIFVCDLLSKIQQPINFISSPTFIRNFDPSVIGHDVRFLLSAGGPLFSKDRQKGLYLCPYGIHEIYGSTETGIIASRRHSDSSIETPWQTVPGVKIEHTDSCSTLISPLLSEVSFELEDHLDMVSPNSFLLKGRKDKIIKIGEKRFSLTEIKKAVEAATGKETQILPVYKNDRLFIGAIIKNESPVTGEDIKHWRSLLLNKVEPLVVPRLWRNVTEFPMTAQGKLDTACLLELFDE